jgi:tetratricopeptide (TPR) repeat protein
VRPHDTVLNYYDIPQVQAAIAIKTGKPANAIELMKPSLQYPDGAIEVPFYRGLSYYSMKSWKEAEEQFAKSKSLRTIWVINPLVSVNQLYLARSLAMAGDTAATRREYQDLLAFWKDADPDMPLLVQAKAEYAKLQ